MTSPQPDPFRHSNAVPEVGSPSRIEKEHTGGDDPKGPELSPLFEARFQDRTNSTPSSADPGARPTRELTAEPLCFANRTEALEIAYSAFPRKTDQEALKLSFRLYSCGIRTLPEKTLGKWGWSTMTDYRLWRDENGEAIAFSGNWKLGRTPEALWIGWVGVKPTARGGVGTYIINQIEAEAREAGYKELMLYHKTANEKLSRLYTRLGFDFVETSTAWGEEVTVRSKNLSQPNGNTL